MVVTGFGMAQKKATLTGAVSSVKSTDIERSSAVTASGALVGKIAGLNSRQQGGAPGATTALQIRNMGTPLFVIDGVVSDEGQFNNMDFNDIENISILKDASAALYGVRAANGVIVVTTKKGQRNTRNTVSVDAYYGWQKNSKFVDPADVKEYVHAYTTAETFQEERMETDVIAEKNMINGWQVQHRLIKDGIGEIIYGLVLLSIILILIFRRN